MRSRTRSESVLTFSPSTVASPSLSGRRPVNILMTVVFPLPLGPKKPKISPLATSKLTPFTAVNLPKLRTSPRARMAGSVGGAPPFGFWLAGVTGSASTLEFHVGGHAGKNVARRIVDTDFHAEDLVHAFFARLDVARKKLGLLVDLFHDACKGLAPRGIHGHLGFVADFYPVDFGFRDVDADVDFVALKQRRHGGIGGDEVARTNVQHFHGCNGRRRDLAFAKARFVQRQSGLRRSNVLAPIAALHHFKRGFGLREAGLCAGDFLGTVAPLQLVELVLCIFALGDGDFPVGFGGVALLFRHQILFCQRFVTFKVQAGAGLIGGGAIEIGCGGGYVFLAVAVSPHIVVGLGLFGCGTRLGNFLGAVTAPGLLGAGARLFKRRQQFLVVKRNEQLAGLDVVAFPDQHFVDSAADFRADANVAGFHRARAFQSDFLVEPAAVEHACRDDGGNGCHDDSDALGFHFLFTVLSSLRNASRTSGGYLPRADVLRFLCGLSAWRRRSTTRTSACRKWFVATPGRSLLPEGRCGFPPVPGRGESSGRATRDCGHGCATSRRAPAQTTGLPAAARERSPDGGWALRSCA